MSEEQNKAVVRRLLDEVFNQGNLEAADELISADSVAHVPGGAGPQPELEVTKAGAATFRAAFPDLHITVEDMIAEGDKVAARVTLRGTHKGELKGIPPSGTLVTVTGMRIMRFSRGKIQETWINRDHLGMLQQLGVKVVPEADGLSGRR